MTAPCKRRDQFSLPLPQLTIIHDEISEYIAPDVRLTRDLDWKDFVKERRRWGYFSYLGGVDHLTHRLLRQYRYRGDPVVFSERRWVEVQKRASPDRVPHQSMMARAPFLREEFALIVGKGQWFVFPYSTAREITGLRMIPP